MTLRETAVDACSRKEHCVKRGYYVDPFLTCFTGDNTYVNSPLMNRGYWLRVKAVEEAVNRFLELVPEEAVQIVSLGAGYDTLYFRWAAAATGKVPPPSAPGTPGGSHSRPHRASSIGRTSDLSPTPSAAVDGAAPPPPTPSSAGSESEASSAGPLRHTSAATAKAIAEAHATPAATRAATLPSAPRVADFSRIHRYVELDHADVCHGKRDVVDRNPLLHELANLQSMQSQLPQAERATKSNAVYRIVQADLTQPESVVAALLDPALAARSVVCHEDQDSHPVLDATMPTLFIAECVLVYMTAAESTAVMKTFLDRVIPAPVPVGFFSYDAVQPNDRFGQVMVDTLRKRGIALRGIHDLPNPHAHEVRARTVGCNCVRAASMSEWYQSVPLEHRRALDAIERIDDWEEWNLLHDHYCILFAARLSAADAEKRAGVMPQLFIGTFA
jgi:hypothetical protein